MLGWPVSHAGEVGVRESDVVWHGAQCKTRARRSPEVNDRPATGQLAS